MGSMVEKTIGLGDTVKILYEGDADPVLVMLVSEQQKKRGEVPKDIFGITIASPLAQALLGRHTGEKVSFERDGEHIIVEIV